jgi:hypothetical protein
MMIAPLGHGEDNKHSFPQRRLVTECRRLHRLHAPAPGYQKAIPAIRV